MRSDRSFFCGLDARVKFIVDSEFFSKKQSDYIEYCRYVDINQRINNRSWLCNSYDGAMVLSYKYKRRHQPKDAPYEDRPKYGCSITGFWNSPY